jgi:phenylalanyl-tRNA synthetase beta chain
MFPPVNRDLSLIVAESLPYEKVLKTLRGSAGNLLESSSLIDLYRGASIGAEKKSLTVSLQFRNRDRTLNDAEVEKIMDKVKADLTKKCEAVVRQ